MATLTHPESLVPAATLQHLTPQEEGFWLVAEQNTSHVSLAYIMRGGTYAVAYRIVTCSTVAEVTKEYQHLIYSHPDEPNVNSVPGSSSRIPVFTQPVHLELIPDFGNFTSQQGNAHERSENQLDHAAIRAQVVAALRSAMSYGTQSLLGSIPEVPPQGTTAQLLTTDTDQYQQDFNWNMSNDFFPSTSSVIQDQASIPFNNMSGSMGFISTFESNLNPSLPEPCNEAPIDWELYTAND